MPLSSTCNSVPVNMKSALRPSVATLTLLIAYLQCFAQTINTYVLPETTFQVLKPLGLRVSIPDADGVQFFTFHGNVNRGIVSTELGDIHGDAFKSQDGRWTVEDRSVNLRDGDVINYWIYVQAGGASFRRDDQRWIVVLRSASENGPTTVRPRTVTNRAVSGDNSLFEENFDSLNASIWTREVKIPLEPNYEFCVYHNDYHEQLVTVSGGILKIQPLVLEDYYGENATAYGMIRLNPCSSRIAAECTRQAVSYNIIPPVISARLTTKESFSFQHGKVEIRAKFPEGDWLYPEMWLEPKYNSQLPDETRGCILLGLARGNEDLVNVTTRNVYDSRKLDFGVRIGWTRNIREILVSKTRQTGARWTQGFHTYTTLWNADGFQYFVDGEEVGRLNPGSNGWLGNSERPKEAPFDQEYVLTIGVGVGGIRVFPDGTTAASYPKPWTNVGAKAMLKFWHARNDWLPSWRRNDGRRTAFEIDYIRVHSL